MADWSKQRRKSENKTLTVDIGPRIFLMLEVCLIWMEGNRDTLKSVSDFLFDTLLFVYITKLLKNNSRYISLQPQRFFKF